jgi:MSHA biogenesis protein MshQ
MNNLKLIATFIILTLFSFEAFGVCSAYRSYATINEAGKVGFVEIKLLDAGIPSSVYSTWNVSICEGQRNRCSGQLSLSTTPLINNVYLPRQTNFVPNNQPFDIILTDGVGNTIDYLSVNYTPQQDASCAPAFDWTSPISNSHDYHRMPDGTGDWTTLPGNSGGDSEGDTNQAGLPTLNTANITVERGQLANFTLTLSETSSQDVTLFYQTVDDTAFANTHYTPQTGSFVIPAGAISATLSIQTSAGSPGGDVDFFLFLYDADNASILNHYPRATITQSLADHFVITHDGSAINCLRESITFRVENASGGLVNDYTGTVNLSLVTNNGNWYTLDSSGFSSDPALGTLTDTAGDNDGQATYTFDLNDNGQVVLYLQNTVAEISNIQISDGSIADDNSEGNITFRPFGYLFSPNPIPTQIAGRPFNVTLTAAGQTPTQANCGVIEEYDGVRSVNYWNSYTNPVASPTSVSINGVNIASSEALSTPQNTTFTNGISTISVLYNDVGEISLSAKDEIDIGEPPIGSNDEIIGGISPFVVRPFGYDIQIDTEPFADGSGATAAYRAADANFNMTLRSVLWQAVDDLDNNGIPDPFIDSDADGTPDSGGDLSDNGVTPNIANTPGTIGLSPQALFVTNFNGSLTTTSVSHASFVAPGGAGEGTLTFAQSWNEVGVLQIDAVSNDYMSGGENVTGQRINIGRFIPDHYIVSAPVLVEQCGGFTYAGFFDGVNAGLDKPGQTFQVSGTITAQNSSNGTTQNYQNQFAKLTTSDLVASGFDTTNTLAATGRVNFGSAALSFASGVSNYSDTTADYQHDQLAAPFALRVDLQASDSDSVTSAIANSNPIEVRLGRLRLIDSYGPEVTALEMLVMADYYDGTNWTINTADSCTTFINTDASFDLTSYTDQLNNGETSITAPSATTNIINGQSAIGAGLEFSPPGDGNYGSVSIEYDVSSQPWLQFDWDADNIIDTPSATLNFGYYRGSDRVIYWKEVRN